MTEPIPMDPAPPSARRRMEINPPVFFVSAALTVGVVFSSSACASHTLDHFA